MNRVGPRRRSSCHTRRHPISEVECLACVCVWAADKHWQSCSGYGPLGSPKSIKRLLKYDEGISCCSCVKQVVLQIYIIVFDRLKETKYGFWELVMVIFFFFLHHFSIVLKSNNSTTKLLITVVNCSPGSGENHRKVEMAWVMPLRMLGLKEEINHTCR